MNCIDDDAFQVLSHHEVKFENTSKLRTQANQGDVGPTILKTDRHLWNSEKKHSAWNPGWLEDEDVSFWESVSGSVHHPPKKKV